MSDLSLFTREFLKEFIQIYKENPCLWEINSKAYVSRVKKNEAYKKLLKKLQEVDQTASKRSVIQKLIAIRNGFRNERRKVLKSFKSGRDVSKYIPNLWYYSLLKEFMGEKDFPRPSLSNISLVGPYTEKVRKSPVSSNLERPVELHHGGLSSELHQRSSPVMIAATNGSKRSLDSNETTWNLDPISIPASDYSILQDSLMLPEEEEMSTKREEDRTSNTFIQNDNYYEEEPPMIASDPPPPPPPTNIPKLRQDCGSILGLAYEELSKFRQLFFAGPQESLKEHDQFGLDVAEDLRAFNNTYYTGMAKLKIREIFHDIQKMAFGSIRPNKPKLKTKHSSYSQHPTMSNHVDNISNECPRSHKRRASSLQPNEDQASVGSFHDPDASATSILPLELQDGTLDSIIIKNEEPLDVEDIKLLDETPPTTSEDRTMSSSPSQSSRVLHQLKDSCSKRPKTSYEQPPHTGGREMTQQKLPLLHHLNISPGLVRARPPASAAPTPSGGLQPPEKRHVLILPNPVYTSTTTITTTTAATTTTTTNTGLVRPSTSFEGQIPKTSIPNPDVPDPPRLTVDLQNSPFETVMVKEEMIDMDFSDKLMDHR